MRPARLAPQLVMSTSVLLAVTLVFGLAFMLASGPVGASLPTIPSQSCDASGEGSAEDDCFQHDTSKIAGPAKQIRTVEMGKALTHKLKIHEALRGKDLSLEVQMRTVAQDGSTGEWKIMSIHEIRAEETLSSSAQTLALCAPNVSGTFQLRIGARVPGETRLYQQAATSTNAPHTEKPTCAKASPASFTAAGTAQASSIVLCANPAACHYTPTPTATPGYTYSSTVYFQTSVSDSIT